MGHPDGSFHIQDTQLHCTDKPSSLQKFNIPGQDALHSESLLVESWSTRSHPDMNFHVHDTRFHYGNFLFLQQAMVIMFISIMVDFPWFLLLISTWNFM